MKLPNAHLAIVERKKVVGYLLNPAHPDNGGKARFFAEIGFAADRWEILSQALKNAAASGKVLHSVQSIHGSKYVVDGEIVTPVGKRSNIRSIWIIDLNSELPRLITAYPAKK